MDSVTALQVALFVVAHDKLLEDCSDNEIEDDIISDKVV